MCIIHTQRVLSLSVGCCQGYLKKFSLTVEPESSSLEPSWSHTDSEKLDQDVYTVVPSPRISFPVSQTRIEIASTEHGTVSALCELFVFGGWWKCLLRVVRSCEQIFEKEQESAANWTYLFKKITLLNVRKVAIIKIEMVRLQKLYSVPCLLRTLNSRNESLYHPIASILRISKFSFLTPRKLLHRGFIWPGVWTSV